MFDLADITIKYNNKMGLSWAKLSLGLGCDIDKLN